MPTHVVKLGAHEHTLYSQFQKDARGDVFTLYIEKVHSAFLLHLDLTCPFFKDQSNADSLATTNMLLIKDVSERMQVSPSMADKLCSGCFKDYAGEGIRLGGYVYKALLTNAYTLSSNVSPSTIEGVGVSIKNVKAILKGILNTAQGVSPKDIANANLSYRIIKNYLQSTEDNLHPLRESARKEKHLYFCLPTPRYGTPIWEYPTGWVVHVYGTRRNYNTYGYLPAKYENLLIDFPNFTSVATPETQEEEEIALSLLKDDMSVEDAVLCAKALSAV